MKGMRGLARDFTCDVLEYWQYYCNLYYIGIVYFSKT
jgi:hypothetical protein